MRRQFAIASAGRTASTTLFHSLVNSLSLRHAVCPVWDFSPAERLAEAYAGDRFDYVVVKGETWHFVEQLRHRDVTTLILLTRQDHVRQIVSHLVSLRAGKFHARAGAAPAPPLRIGRHEFLSLAHMILAMEDYFAGADFGGFDRLERWRFEDLTADVGGHLRALGVDQPRIAPQRGVAYDEATVLNMDQVLGWAAALQRDGLRMGALAPA